MDTKKITYYCLYYPSKNYHTVFGLDQNNILNGIYEEYYDHINYFKHCNYKNYNYSNRQQIKIRCNFLDGKLHGKHTKYFENGLLHKKSNYLNGKLNGKYEEWYNNFDIPMLVFSRKYLLKFKLRCKRVSSNYLNGERHGTCTNKHANGKIFYVRKYKNGIQI